MPEFTWGNRPKNSLDRKLLADQISMQRSEVKRLQEIMARPEVQQERQARLQEVRAMMADTTGLDNAQFTDMLRREGQNFPYAEEEQQLVQAQQKLEQSEEIQAEVGKPDGFLAKIGQRFGNFFRGKGFHDNETLEAKAEASSANVEANASTSEAEVDPRAFVNGRVEDRVAAFSAHAERLVAQDAAQAAERANSGSQSQQDTQSREELQSALDEQFALDNPEQENPLDENDVEAMRNAGYMAQRAALIQQFDEANGFGQAPSSFARSDAAENLNPATTGVESQQESLEEGVPVHI